MSDWYNTEWEADPKGAFVADLALGDGMWDAPIRCSPCDLHWSPGWLLRGGWPSSGWSSWPNPEQYHELQQRRARLPANLR